MESEESTNVEKYCCDLCSTEQNELILVEETYLQYEDNFITYSKYDPPKIDINFHYSLFCVKFLGDLICNLLKLEVRQILNFKSILLEYGI